MKSVNEIAISWLINNMRVIRPILISGGALALFGFFARLGFFYGSETNQSVLQALLTAGGLALVAVIVFLCFHFYDTPEIVGHLGGAVVGLCVGGMIAGAGMGGHWGMPVKILAGTLGTFVAAAPFILAMKRQKSR